jgi:uncharacterized membrane protein YccC
MRAATPQLLFGLRLWVAVCLALYVAFWLELQNPFWAGTTAAIVCQPTLGASLRKGWFRMIGTVIGAIVSVVIAAAFPQDRLAFLFTLAVWGALCGLVASLLRNFAAYAAALSGYSAVIICMDMLGSVGTGSPNVVFDLAVTRATEICLGIVCAGLVLASTDVGHARGRLATVIGNLTGEIADGVMKALSQPGSQQDASRALRRGLVSRVAALDALIDNVLGESPTLRFHPRGLQGAMDGLFTALSGWRGIATHIELRPALAEVEATSILAHLPASLRAPAESADWLDGATVLRRNTLLSARSLITSAVATPSARLLADQTAVALLGLGRALQAIIVLNDPMRADPRPSQARLRVPDILPPLISAVRVAVAIGLAMVLWVGTAWPGGETAVTFSAVTAILFAPREDAAYDTARGFLLGTVVTAVFAGLIGFLLLPAQTSFVSLCLVCALVLVPAGALSAGTWHGPLFVAMAANFIPLLGPSNPMVYDLASFLNTATALVIGVGISIITIRLVPPLPVRVRVRRLAALTLRDLRRLADRPAGRSASEWENHVYGRLAAVPDQADMLQAARLVAALATGAAVIRLHRSCARLGVQASAQDAFAALSRGDTAATLRALGHLDAILPQTGGETGLMLRARGNVAAIAEALMQHDAYFRGEVDA